MDAPLKVLVTGGTGFIGTYVCEELTRRGYDTLTYDFAGPADFPYTITDADQVYKAMSQVGAWIHLAGLLGTQETIPDPRPAAYTNIMGGLNMLEAAAQFALPGVMIAVGNHWMNNPYSITKSTMERFLDMYRTEKDVNVSIVRVFDAYGPRQEPPRPYGQSSVRKIIPSFVTRALVGDDVEIYGTGKQVSDMIHVTDVARIMVDTLEETLVNGYVPYILEAGTGRDLTVNDVAQLVIDEAASLTGLRSQITYLPMRPGEPLDAIVLCEDVPEDLLAFEDGIQETVYWYWENWLPGYKAGLSRQ